MTSIALIFTLAQATTPPGQPPRADPGSSVTAPSGRKKAPKITEELVEEGPVDFRCDNMRVGTRPNKTLCQTNVVVRRGDLLLCCERFEGHADDDWQWQRLVCSGKVRAVRGIETMWAERAEFLMERSDLILTGEPLLHRGKTVFEGERIIIDVKEDRARIEKPRGRMVQEDPVDKAGEAAPPAWLEGSLPAVCPLPASPAR